ncbi:MAG: ATP-grasp domain-containing protein [Alphaproteobacteria bacterium]|nr:ATP-grasp domain-containing protein [Alphaproteobacteria bacterium]MBF0129624.1 ATP-grasp domain-containing protein [Alphaproteobacteria bacterium]
MFNLLDLLSPHLRIAVIFGGTRHKEGAVITPTHNPRSDKTYEAVAADIAAALGRCGFAHVELMPEDMTLGERLRRFNANFAWLNSGGTQGYASSAHGPSLLELFGIPYVGHNPLNAAVLDNKHMFKYALQGLGLPTPRFVVVHFGESIDGPGVREHFQAVFGDGSGPFVVKPVSGRASLHVHLVEQRKDLSAAVAAVHAATENSVLVEAFLSGREYCIGVCGPLVIRGGVPTRQDRPFCFSALERTFEAGERIFTSMDVKPISSARFRLLDDGADAEIARGLVAIGEAIYTAFNLETAVRLDIRAGTNGNLSVLEANPKPDLKFPKDGQASLITAGLDRQAMSYDDLILTLLANRLDFLVTRRPSGVPNILRLLNG